MRRLLLLLCFVLSATAARADDSAGKCPKRPPVAIGAPSRIVLELDPATRWRPRTGEVRFTIKGTGGAPPSVKQVRVCFGWDGQAGADDTMHALIGSPQVRSVISNTGAAYGAVVPKLPALDDGWGWPRRVLFDNLYAFDGFYTVPVADMVVEITSADGSQETITTSAKVGVTNATVAWIVVAVAAGLLWLGMRRLAARLNLPGDSLLLKAISTSDGYASLSQAQIVLWTVVVGLSAIYVMTLSGNLINISSGTLVLLVDLI
jgi:hypothetical protein